MSSPRCRTLSVVHDTTYRYDAPVTKSRHQLRLRPVHDHTQDLLDFHLEVTPAGDPRAFEDLYGNHVAHLELETPFTEMRIVGRSRVRVTEPPAIARPVPTGPSVVPLAWTPGQHQILQPYLLPPDLPHEHLRELKEYAMSFAELGDYDLLDVLLGMTQAIQRDFEYVPGSTSIESTSYECYLHRRGVCQDFTNLLMTMVRLLNVPARYRVGYIFTGGNYQHTEQSEASHAWVEIYIPWVGWRGFDPTNGRMTDIDHVRVACGRSHDDAPPTAGIIYKGGGNEVLSVTVRVEEVDRET